MVDNHLAIQGGVQSLNLIHEPLKAVMLHGSGILVLVPAPAICGSQADSRPTASNRRGEARQGRCTGRGADFGVARKEIGGPAVGVGRGLRARTAMAQDVAGWHEVSVSRNPRLVAEISEATSRNLVGHGADLLGSLPTLRFESRRCQLRRRGTGAPCEVRYKPRGIGGPLWRGWTRQGRAARELP